MGFGFKSIEHAFATIARDIAKGIAVLQVAEPIVEGVTAILDPPAVVIERGAFAALGKIAGAIHQTAVDGQLVVQAKGLDVHLDEQEAADFLQVWQLLQSGLVDMKVIKAAVASPTPAAAGANATQPAAATPAVSSGPFKAS